MQRFLIRLLFFTAVAAVLLATLDSAAPKGWGNAILAEKWVSFDRPAGDSKNVVFVGSSRIYRHIDPAQFDVLVPGANSYNLGSPDSNFLAHLQIVQQLLKSDRQLPQYIFLELQGLPRITDTNRHKFGIFYAHNVKNTLLATRFFSAAGNHSQAVEHLGALIDNAVKVGSFLRIARAMAYRFSDHNRGTQSGFRCLDDELEVAEIADRRQEFLNNEPALAIRRDECTAERHPSISAHEHHDGSSQILSESILELINQCEAMGSKLILVLAPRNHGQYETFLKLPVGHRIDLGDPTRFPQFYQTDLTFDVGHLNREGAALFTEELAKVFLDRFASNIEQN